MKQHTLRSSLSFFGTGLHTGNAVTMRLSPAPAGFGIRFIRTDLAGYAEVEARIGLVEQTRRGITLSNRGIQIRTPEHLLSALSGMGVDNVLVEIDAAEVPILDGSALPYASAILESGLVEQDAEREYLVIEKPFRYLDKRCGSHIDFAPSEETVLDVTIDFDSRLVGVQRAVYDSTVDYASQIAPCRTFCFLHEVRLLHRLGLIRGGSLDNALVIDEPNGYYGGKEPLFDNEPARHKLLDMMGDFALLGRPIRGKITAYKPGHKVNTQALKKLLESL
jgi:UDP-3-O-[3-hydroxymyristoyl] N-acetylglucosamine deacetylase/3-hydroxyacyl-[acyl-carrier-protein] dehydratase